MTESPPDPHPTNPPPSPLPPSHLRRDSIRRTRERDDLNINTASANPLFRKVREFKKQLIQNKLKSQSRSSISGASIFDIHLITNHAPSPQSPMENKLHHLLSKETKKPDSYLQALEEIYQNPSQYTPEESGRIEQLCYLGVGRSLVETKKILPPSYSRVNLLIREFMIDAIERDSLSSLKEQNPDRIYIESNATGLGYKTVVEPQFKEFQDTIRGCNRIVEQEFLSFKRKKEPRINDMVRMSSYSSVVGVALLILYFSSHLFHLAIPAVAGALVVLGICGNLIHLARQERVQVKDTNVIDKIQLRLQEYLDSVNETEQMKGRYSWKCGKDFYWLEVSPLQPTTSSLQ